AIANAAGPTSPSSVMNVTVLPTSSGNAPLFGNKTVLPYGPDAGTVGGSTKQTSNATNTTQQTSNTTGTNLQTSNTTNVSVEPKQASLNLEGIPAGAPRTTVAKTYGSTTNLLLYSVTVSEGTLTA